MPATITPQEFVARWRGVTLTEKSSSQSHFIDLCLMLGQQTPVEADPTGEWYTFERGATKDSGGSGWADVWMRGHFGWEYKGPKKDLNAALAQLQRYAGSLENPPLLVVSDIQTIVVHSNFTNTVKRVERFELDDLLNPDRLDLLHAVWTDPNRYRVEITPDQVTKQAAAEFAKLAESLRNQGEDPHRAAHYLIRLLFCLFAEDVQILPGNVFTRLVAATKNTPEQFTGGLRALFGAMATGGMFGVDPIPHVDGQLFDNAETVPISRPGLTVLDRVAKLDWASMDPSIFGTLFERSLDPAKRAQLGAHYTARSDIELIVEPVLMAPLRRRWAAVQEEAHALVAKRDGATRQQRDKIDDQALKLVMAFMFEISAVQVLDPACGSGNFLYVSLRMLLDLWKEVWVFLDDLGLKLPMALGDLAPSPDQLHGIETDAYAHELAQVTIWIGYIQWLRDNGFGVPREPILKSLDNIVQMDAILAYDGDGHPVEPEWPAVDVVVGNPPFLGDKKMRSQLGDRYVDDLRSLHQGRVPGGTDLVGFWFERSRHAIEQGTLQRAGLLATNSLPLGLNRTVLDRIKASGDIFMAWRDRPWVLDGANVRVCMIGFDDGSEAGKHLNGLPVYEITADLRSSGSVITARPLAENRELCFVGDTKKGHFEVDRTTADNLIRAVGNPNGRSNTEVVVPWMNALDVTRRPRSMWIIDFGVSMAEFDAAQFELPYALVRQRVKPARDVVRNPLERRLWWLHGRTAPGMRRALQPLWRFIATPIVSKHRVFVWVPRGVLVDHGVAAVARDDDYSFGVLHSKLHELWSLRLGTSLEDRPRYTPSTTFETYPFPWPPGTEPTDDPRVIAIAEAARELVEKRDRWLNPEGASEAELKKRTLTNLYNKRDPENPTWLDLAHRKLDEAVFAAYGWPADLSDDEVLERLLALNQMRGVEGT